MATKLLDVTQFETALTATAAAIRAKSGSLEDITFSMEDGFADAIAALSTDLDDATGENFGTIIINFTIEGVAYQAENGMTWENWDNSEYNTSDFHASTAYAGSFGISNGGMVKYGAGKDKLIALNSTTVDIYNIIEEQAYSTKNGW